MGQTANEVLVAPRARRWGGARDLGVIAGNLPLGLGRLVGPLDGPNDGTVLVEETRLPGAAAHLTVRTSHSSLVYSATRCASGGDVLAGGTFRPAAGMIRAPAARARDRKMSYRRARLRATARSPGRRPPGSIRLERRAVLHRRSPCRARAAACRARGRGPLRRAAALLRRPTPRAAVHQHLGQICAVRLVFGKIEDQLHGADDAQRVLGDEERAATINELRRDAAPERGRLVERERTHEAHGRAAVHAVDQDFGQTLDLGVGRRQQADGSQPGPFMSRSALAEPQSRSLNREIQASRGLISSGSKRA